MRSHSRVLTAAGHSLIALTCALTYRHTQTLRSISAGAAPRHSPESHFCPNTRRPAVAQHPDGQALPFFYYHNMTLEALVSRRSHAPCWYLCTRQDKTKNLSDTALHIFICEYLSGTEQVFVLSESFSGCMTSHQHLYWVFCSRFCISKVFKQN